MKTDILIIGSGIAGLNTACQIANLRPELNIVIATKTTLENSNSAKAQGGVAIPLNNPQSLHKHILDTYLAGDKYADPKLIENILKHAPDVLEDIKLYNLQFDQKSDGSLDRTIEGGHSEKRIVHVKDFTGRAIITAMIKKLKSFKNITVLENSVAQHLLNDENSKHSIRCVGSTFVSAITGEAQKIYASATILATGGIGSLFKSSTNIDGSNGDGLFLAHEIGAKLSSLEFVQFHPTGLDVHKKCTPLITEALRGEGAFLVNDKNERFMSKYDFRLELAPRDIVSRAIIFELMNQEKGQVYLDARHIDEEKLRNRFPEIYKLCLDANINPKTEKIPVIPVQHYHCGGIATDLVGRTNINSLYACGECACTTLHGANRLASNSLLEALIVSKQIAIQLSSLPNARIPVITSATRPTSYSLNGDAQFEKLNLELQDILTNEVGIVRTNNGLHHSFKRLEQIEKIIEESYPHPTSLKMHELRSRVKTAKFITEAAMRQHSNYGCHFNLNNQESKAIHFT
ncbi:MAG: L-aspartate oxidase [Bacteroidetes bacterium]|nr:MAG: L-aspartate oxidase [Bacteroidota bacterium]